MAKREEPAEMDLNLMRPTQEQRPAPGVREIDEPVSTVEDRRAHFGSHVLGFVGGAAHVLNRTPRV